MTFHKLQLARAQRHEMQRAAAKAASGIPAIAAKADDLEALKKSVEDAAIVSGALWLSYLFVLFYLAVASGAVTHTDLLMENPVKLPFLNIELPLRAFFFLTPFLFLITHAYALVHFKMLALKTLNFHGALKQQLPDSEATAAQTITPHETRDKLRRLLPSNIFVQLLAGPPELRKGIVGFILRLMTQVTLVILPVLLLLLLQIQFLPYHDITTTWAQRLALCLDIILLWSLKLPTLGGGIGKRNVIIADVSKPRWRDEWGRWPVLVLMLAFNIAALWLSFVIATLPGEWQETALAKLDPAIWSRMDLNDPKAKLISTREYLFAGDVDSITRRRKSLFSNTLVLPGFNLYEALKIDDPKKLAWKDHLIDLRGRHLEKAVLSGAVLRQADLNGAYLDDAVLERAELQGASFDMAFLQRARLFDTHLQGASLKNTLLRGATLENAQLQGATLRGAQLQGAVLKSAQLQGASLWRAQLQGAFLHGAQLQGAVLTNAQLQGASLWGAKLQGASIDTAELQGAVLIATKMEATDLTGSYLWRADWGVIDSANIRSNHFSGIEWNPFFENPLDDYPSPVPWKSVYDSLRDSLNAIPEGKLRDDAFKRYDDLDCNIRSEALASCDYDAPPTPKVDEWQKQLTQGSTTDDDDTYQKKLFGIVGELSCSGGDDAIYILRGLMRSDEIFVDEDRRIEMHGRLFDIGPKTPALVSFIMDKGCPVSTLLTNEDKAKLLAFRTFAMPLENK